MAAPRGRAPLFTQAKQHIFQHIQMREQRIVLKHETDTACLGRHNHAGVGHQLAIEPDFSLTRTLETGGKAKQCRLATTRRPEKGHDLAFADTETDIPD